jgi:uncharacterized membrane protein YphA (DoxX/SURF4 family)
MFSMFPDRWPGAGLLLLRVGCGIVLIVQGAASFGAEHELVALIAIFVMIAAGLLLLIGFLTRFAALIAAMVGVTSALDWLPNSGPGPLESPMTALLSAVMAIALVCLGAGAFSLDSRLFGRREIIIPARSSNA